VGVGGGVRTWTTVLKVRGRSGTTKSRFLTRTQSLHNGDPLAGSRGKGRRSGVAFVRGRPFSRCVDAHSQLSLCSKLHNRNQLLCRVSYLALGFPSVAAFITTYTTLNTCGLRRSVHYDMHDFQDTRGIRCSVQYDIL